MKIKKGFELCEVMGKTIAVPSGELANSFPGMIKMNGSCADIWKWIEAEKDTEEIIALYTDTYDVTAEEAAEEVKRVIKQMTDAGILEL